MDITSDFHTIADETPISLVVLDENQRLIWGNQAWRDYTGGQERKISFAATFVHPEDQKKVEASICKVYENPRQITTEFRYQRKDGEYRMFQAISSPLEKSGKVAGLVCVLSDMTDQQMIEEQMMMLNESLEDMVEERTAELKQANDDLKSTQSQMLHHEKMASVGQLAAGVAHEINNPMGFIASNLGSLGKYLSRLNGYISQQEALLSSMLDEHAKDEWKKEKRKLKIDYLLEDSEDLIAESLDGAGRVQEIVSNLKSFSRIDQAEELVADINECIENTILVAWNELKYHVTLEKDFGELPELHCHPQQLNQVFMNILINAAHAIDEQGVVKIKTWHDEEGISIQISDTGCGIPEENLSRIFEPFFTTKDVGKGTGLGMSISYEIVRSHGGDIQVKSTVGEGTTFRIILPLGGEGKANV